MHPLLLLLLFLLFSNLKNMATVSNVCAQWSLEGVLP
jgi:hypothetical protein